jgi:hypothetical protein
MKRYRVGFDEGVSCIAKDLYPDLFLVVDTDSVFGYGEVVAMCFNQHDAKKVCDDLNIAHEVKTNIQ